MLAPAGLNVELTFPAREIISAYRTGTRNGIGVVNLLTFTLPVENIENEYNVDAPGEVLLVLKKDLDNFFLKNSLPDNVTSFRATLGTLANGYQGYSFSDMRTYIVNLMEKETIADEDVTFVLLPITVTTESNKDYYGSANTTLTAVDPFVTAPKMARILPEKAKINFVYSLQTTNF